MKKWPTGIYSTLEGHYFWSICLFIFADHKFYVAYVAIKNIDVLDYFGGLKHVTVKDYFSENITLIINSDTVFSDVAVLQIDV